MIGLAAKAAIVLSRRLGCLPITFDRNRSALAIGENVGLCLLISLGSLLAVAARPAESAVQFFCALAFFVDAPGMIG
jgi:uncharacterized membrane protein